MIKFENVSKNYGKNTILKNLNFEINDGQFVVLIGPSGCGKTTTLKMINRLFEPNEGRILIDGNDIANENKVELRRHIGYVIQQIGLFPNMTVLENIKVVPKLLKKDKFECEKIAREMLELIGMEEYANKYPSELSGGQQQRVGVLRALAGSPKIVLMDEPFSALDPQTRELLQNEVKNIQQKLGNTFIFVTHDMNEALKLADTIIFMDKGEIVQMASPAEMLENPASDMIKDFLGKHSSEAKQLTNVEDFMRKNVQTIKKTSSVIECVDKMRRCNVDSLIVVDKQNKYLGTVSIGDIRKNGKGLKNIDTIIKHTARTVYVGDNAKDSFDYLLDTGASYVIVLDKNDCIVGIVTKTSVARSVAENLWRE